MIPDPLYVRLAYFRRMKKFPNLKNPKTFNEKLQWLKLYNRNPEHTRIVDKYEAKQYIAERIGEEYIIPTLGVWNNFDEIDFDSLPEQFVLKCTHDSGGLVICRDKSELDLAAARKKIEASLKTNYYWHSREWPYKNVIPRILAEQYMIDESGTQLKDYKIFCFNGQPYCIQVDFDRFTEHKKNLYTLDWELLEFSFNYPAHPEVEIAKPPVLDKMLELARVLSAGEPYVRVDFYCIDGKPYVGEITFFPASGYGKFVPEKYDTILGEKIQLPKNNRKGWMLREG